MRGERSLLLVAGEALFGGQGLPCGSCHMSESPPPDAREPSQPHAQLGSTGMTEGAREVGDDVEAEGVALLSWMWRVRGLFGGTERQPCREIGVAGCAEIDRGAGSRPRTPG